MRENAATVCGHRCPQHPGWLPCQLPPGHATCSGHRHSAGQDVQHVWQGEGHRQAAAVNDQRAGASR